MIDPLPLRAEFCDLRPVKSRKVVQLIFEVPIEAADHAIGMLGGFPRPDQSRWVGIVRLNPERVTQETLLPATTPPPKGRWADMPLPQRAGLLCKEPAFRKFFGLTAEPDAAAYVRHRCRVVSRGHIEPNHSSGREFLIIEREYFAGIGDEPAQDS